MPEPENRPNVNDYLIATDIMGQRCIINAARIKVMIAEFEELMKRVNERELTPALLRQAAWCMTRLDEVIEEGLLDRRALDDIIRNATAEPEKENDERNPR